MNYITARSQYRQTIELEAGIRKQQKKVIRIKIAQNDDFRSVQWDISNSDALLVPLRIMVMSETHNNVVTFNFL